MKMIDKIRERLKDIGTGKNIKKLREKLRLIKRRRY